MIQKLAEHLSESMKLAITYHGKLSLELSQSELIL